MEKDDFLKKLEKLVAHAKSKHNTVDAGEINDFFVGDNLTPEQMDQIYSYLENNGMSLIPCMRQRLLKSVSPCRIKYTIIFYFLFLLLFT